MPKLFGKTYKSIEVGWFEFGKPNWIGGREKVWIEKKVETESQFLSILRKPPKSSNAARGSRIYIELEEFGVAGEPYLDDPYGG